MRTTFVLAFLLALGSFSSAASAEEPTRPPGEKRFPRWRIAHFAELGLALVDDGGGVVVHGVEASYALFPHLRVGGAVQLPILAGGYYTAMSFGLRGFAELHALPRSFVDPWIHAGLATLLHTSGHRASPLEVAPDYAAFASVGVDFNLGPVFLSPYGTLSAFVGKHANLGIWGLRLGGQF